MGRARTLVIGKMQDGPPGSLNLPIKSSKKVEELRGSLTAASRQPCRSSAVQTQEGGIVEPALENMPQRMDQRLPVSTLLRTESYQDGFLGGPAADTKRRAAMLSPFIGESIFSSHIIRSFPEVRPNFPISDEAGGRRLCCVNSRETKIQKMLPAEAKKHRAFKSNF